MKRDYARWLSLLVLTGTLASSGCDRAEIEGKVVDGLTHAAIPDVTVSIAGTTFQSKTGKDGRYSVPYAPGEVTVNFARPGFSASSFSASLAQKTRYPASDINLYRIPPSPGVWLVDSSGRYIAAGGADICDASETGMEGYAFFTDVTFTVTDLPSYSGAVPAGMVTILDNSGEGLELVRVQDGGVIWRRRAGVTGARENVRRFTPVEEQPVAGMLIRRYDLPAGVYAMVHVNRDEGDAIFGGARSNLLARGGYQFVIGNPGRPGGETPCVLGD